MNDLFRRMQADAKQCNARLRKILHTPDPGPDPCPICGADVPVVKHRYQRQTCSDECARELKRRSTVLGNANAVRKARKK